MGLCMDCLTILSSLAQEESRSISENSTWGIRRRFKQGKVKGPTGATKWYQSTVLSILQNEKYKGEALLQKSYTVDFFNKTRVENNGEVRQYYVQESHPATIDLQTWKTVQLEIERRKKFCEEHNIKKFDYAKNGYALMGRVICGKCGHVFSRKTWVNKIVWQCSERYAQRGIQGCDNKHINDTVLRGVVVTSFNALLDNKEYFLEKWQSSWSKGTYLSSTG